MEQLVSYFESIGVDFHGFLICSIAVIAVTLVLGAAARFIFGKKSTLSGAVSSAIAILFVYALNIVLTSIGAEYAKYIAPLPLITITGDSMTLFNFLTADYTQICSQLLNTVILAFTVNLIDRVLPKGDNLLTWIIFRILTVALAQVAYLAVSFAFMAFLPADVLTYAPVILLGLLILMFLTGALKLLVGLLLSSVNPLVGALYTFFFATVVGHAITKAILTTAILSGIVLLLQQFGIVAISIALGALYAYIPLLLILLLVWFLVLKLF